MQRIMSGGVRRLVAGAIALVAPMWTGTAAAATDGSAGKLSPIDRLIAKEDIRQQIALYALLADGDGVKPKDPRTLADKMMTADVVTEIYRPGEPTPIRMIGRDAVAGPPRDPAAPPVVAPSVSRHYLVETYFEDLTATTAKTITTAVHFEVERSQPGKKCTLFGKDACPVKAQRTTMWTYQMKWVKTSEGWQMAYNGLYFDN